MYVTVSCITIMFGAHRKLCTCTSLSIEYLFLVCFHILCLTSAKETSVSKHLLSDSYSYFEWKNVSNRTLYNIKYCFLDYFKRETVNGLKNILFHVFQFHYNQRQDSCWPQCWSLYVKMQKHDNCRSWNIYKWDFHSVCNNFQTVYFSFFHVWSFSDAAEMKTGVKI